ncbi:OmpH family outer membrane protein [Pseudomonas sp. R4-39-08]|uniref:OmpH family outer membrane protein n=1 Tax=Pseudomonas sp. R4-39-08 TaxID=1173288 RepID=UPI000F560CD0|nr:OmpH family outer membrane protein [Pseudomonas sp. R4-39-08]
MNDITREELSQNLSAIEERMDKRIDRMERSEERRSDDFRKELALRDTQLQRELDIRQEAFRAEQAARDAALSEKFAGFFAAQTERDKALEKISESRFERIEKDISSIKADTKKVGEDVNGIKVTMGKYLGGAIVIGAIASALLGVALKFVFSLAS